MLEFWYQLEQWCPPILISYGSVKPLKDELAQFGVPQSLDALIKLSIQEGWGKRERKEQQDNLIQFSFSSPAPSEPAAASWTCLLQQNIWDPLLLSLDSIDSPLFLIILGMPWLQVHNPRWGNQVSFAPLSSVLSTRNCLWSPSLFYLDSDSEICQSVPLV